MKLVSHLLGLFWKPIRLNLVFFTFMYALGWFCTQRETPLHLAGAHPYEQSAPELFADVYMLCTLLALIPRSVRRWVRAGVALLLYVVALADVFCYVRFESTLTPTMLMLCMETSIREAREFVHAYGGADLLTSLPGGVLLIATAHALCALAAWGLSLMRQSLPRLTKPVAATANALLGAATLTLLAVSIHACWPNKQALIRLMAQPDLGAVEHELTTRGHATLYLPIHRLTFALRANQLAFRQTDALIHQLGTARVDSCDFRSPQIVLIIGESYNRHRSQLYGYPLPTTPRQLERAQDSSLVVFTDVVAPWNLTSYVFKHMLSLHAIGDSGQWSSQPLVPEVFRRAGYHVTLLTNQYVQRAAEKVWDFTGGFFLNMPQISDALFDRRNSSSHRYDDGLLADYDAMDRTDHQEHALTIFHLMGQHVDYQSRFPLTTRRRFTPADYPRPDLTPVQRQLTADYDNAVRYNDSIVDQILRRFEQQNAIVIYVPDHGEECFNDSLRLFGRQHSAVIDRRLAREEFEIPFWIWASPLYRETHPYGWQAIRRYRHRPFMTDRLPHTLLFLGGIHTPLYRKELDVLSTDYDAHRPRLLKAVTDYDRLK